MRLYRKDKYHSDPQFNMTPMIDVVFLLIVFFMLVCQFISQENYRLIVPDDCKTVIMPEETETATIQVNVYPQDDDIIYAIASREISRNKSGPALLADLTENISQRAQSITEPRIMLRVHYDLASSDAYIVMQAAAKANIGQIRLAAFDHQRN